MSTPAAFQATAHALRTVGSRKVCQIVFEVPIEKMAEAMAVIGTLDPGTATWFAIARLNPKADEPTQKERRRFDELSPAQQAGIHCNDRVFWRFLNEALEYRVNNADDAANVVRELCHVDSRSDLIPHSEAGTRWRDLSNKFLAWKLAA